MTAEGLGPEWVEDADGVLSRRAARVLLFDQSDRILLVRGHDTDQPERSWWFTVGGGIDVGETPEQAAIRELAEETGLQIEAADLIGPVILRSATFDFYAHEVRQHEVFFLTRVTDPREVTDQGWTAVERDVLDEIRWWSLDELRHVDIEVFPIGLPDLAATLAQGWDGTVVNLGHEDERTPASEDRA